MRLERDKALFPSSRLYRQAGEIADELLLNMQVPVPLGEAVACLRDAGQDLTLRLGELDRPIEALRSAVERQIDFDLPVSRDSGSVQRGSEPRASPARSLCCIQGAGGPPVRQGLD